MMAAKKLCRFKDTLPEDLWLDILCRLSVESLLRCRCVCKTWHHIIGTTSFVKTHLAHQNSSSNKYILYDHHNYTLLTDCEPLVDNTKHSKLYYTPQSFITSALSMEGICNGLFCLSARYHFDYNIFLWNPISRKAKKLPQLIINDDDVTPVDVKGVSVGYYDDNYKVIVFSHGVKTHTKVSVYSLKTNSWKVIPTSTYLYERNNGEPRLGRLYVQFTRFVHGTAYMLTYYGSVPGELRYSVICFSLSDETIRVIKFPEEFSSSRLGIINMEVYEDTVALLGSCARFDSHYLDMWILRISCKSSSSTSPWEKKFSIKLQGDDDGYISYTSPVGFLNNGKYLVRNVVYAEDFYSWVVKLWWCDLESPKLIEFQSHTQVVGEHGCIILPDLYGRIHSNVVESLLLLNEDSLDPFVHTEMESSCSSSALFTLHELNDVPKPSSTQQR